MLTKITVWSKYPPAEPEALRLLAPQRGLTATGESKSKNKSKGLAMQTSLAQFRQIEEEHTPGTVKLLLPPRQSRGNSRYIRKVKRQIYRKRAERILELQPFLDPYR